MNTITDSQPSAPIEANKADGGDCVSRLVLPLRVWWVPQMPMEPFHVTVDSIPEARKILDTLAAYDLFQWQKKVKPDYTNTGGLEVFEDGEWIEWESADGDDIDSVILGENPKLTDA